MDGADSTADEFESNYSSGSDQDLPDSDSSPERARSSSSRVPALVLGIAPPSDQPKQRRPVVPAFKMPAKSMDTMDSKQQPPIRQPVSLPRLALQADQAMARDDPEVAETSILEPAEPSGRDQPEQSLYRADSHNQPGHQHPTPMFTVQLASEAFSIPSGALQEPCFSSMSQTQAVKHFCASQLGLKSSSLRVFELHEVESLTVFSEGCTQLAIAVEGSEFSLSAYEGMLNEMKRLSTENQSMFKNLTSVRNLVDQQSCECGESQEKLKQMSNEMKDKVTHCHKLERELKDQLAHCQKLEKEVSLQRQRIEQSDASRLQGQNSLDQLKADFDKLSAYVSRSPSLDPSSPPRRSGSLTSVPPGSPVSRKLSKSTSCFPDDETTDKMFRMLESLRKGDETILSKLQDVLDAMC